MSIAWLLFARSLTQSWRRLLFSMLAVCVGVMMLLVFTQAFHGLGGRSTHVAWRSEVFNAQSNPQEPIAGVRPTYVTLSGSSNVLSEWRGKTIDIAAMAASDATSPSLPSMPTPEPGEYYVSSALKKEMDAHPDDALGVRYGTKLLGIIPDAYLASPDELAVVFGMNLATAKDPASHAAPMYNLGAQGSAYAGYTYVVMAVLYLGIFILLFPVMLFVSIAARLGSAQREQRYAALRLVGATKAQVRQVMMLESLIAAAVGVGLALLLCAALQGVVHNIQFGGQRFWAGDMAISTGEIAGISVATLLFAAITNWWTLRHVETSPLGVVRRQQVQKKPRVWRLLPLLAGLGMVLGSVVSGSQNGRIMLIFGGVIILMFGLVLAGPFVTRFVAHWIAHVTQSAETLLGMKYIASHPQAVYRSVAGVVVALFAGSFYLTTVSGMENLSANAVQSNGYSRLATGTVMIASDPQKRLPNDLQEKLRQSGYLEQLTLGYQGRDGIVTLPCNAASTYVRLNCPVDKRFVSVDFNRSATSPVAYKDTAEELEEPVFFARVDDSRLDQLRTLIARSTNPITEPLVVISGTQAQRPVINPIIKEFAALAYVGIGVTMLIAVASLIVSTIGGLLERKRSLVTLRLGGMSIASLRKVVLIESLVPLLGVTFIAAAAGVGVGFVMMGALTTTLRATLSPAYGVLFVGCITGAIIAIICVVPSIDRMTDIESNRTE